MPNTTTAMGGGDAAYLSVHVVAEGGTEALDIAGDLEKVQPLLDCGREMERKRSRGGGDRLIRSS